MGRKTNRRNSSSRYLRKGRSNSAPGSARGLLGSAGLAARPSMEQLERRQMLFSLTVTADSVDPVTGLGTVQAFFGYAIPTIGTSVDIQDPQDPQTVAENFSDEPYGFPPFFLGGSGIHIGSTVFPAGDVAIDANPPTVDNQNRFLRVNQNQIGESITIEFNTPADAPTTPLVVDSAQVTFGTLNAGDATGLLVNNVRVDLLRGNNPEQVIASFTGAALQALFTPAGATGVGVLNLVSPAGNPGFDTIRITLISAPPPGSDPTYTVRNISYQTTAPRFAGLITSRLAWGVATITGPVGASASFFDLYGRDMARTIITGIPNEGATRLFIDQNDDGIPDFNDGIGAIRFSNTDSRTSFTLFGGDAAPFTDTVPPDAIFTEGNYAFTLVDSLAGTYDRFEDAGLGYAFDVVNGDVRFTGLPPGPGSVVVGSPYVRSLANYNPGGFAPGVSNPVITGFARADQGLFNEDGGNMGSVYIHGLLHGSSQFNGFVDRIYVGYLVGSVTVAGDLGSLVVGSDAGQWAPDPDFTFTNPDLRLDATNKTFSQLVVGRTLGEFAVGGRGLVDVLVIGDLNNPITRPARDVYNYYEKEYINAIDPTRTVRDTINTTINNTAAASSHVPTDLFRNGDQGPIFGLEFFRNDQIIGAEWVGSISSSVRIKGDLSGRDPTQGDDNVDVFAFSADGTQDIVIEATAGTAPYIRLVDEEGRTLAAPQAANFDVAARIADPNAGVVTQIRYRPKSAGVYYVVITDPNDGAAADTGAGLVSYSINITGMTVATLGAYRTAGGSGFTDINSFEGNSVQVLAGNVGSLRIGTGVVNPAGGADDPRPGYNTRQTADDSMSFQGGSYSIPGNLYNITAGSDIGNPGTIGGGSPISIIVGGDFGNLVTGLSPVVALNVQEGDINFFRLSVGGRIASINVRGGTGFDQDARDNGGNPFDPIGSFVSFSSGTSGGNGDIGFIRFGSHIAGDSLEIRTSNNSTIGAFLVSQDVAPDNVVTPGDYQGIFFGARGVPIRSGSGSDVRFVDTPRIDLSASQDVIDQIRGGEVTEITDDGGSRVQISVVDGAPGVAVGSVRKLAIDESQGAAIARIVVDLSGGASLRINGLTNGNGRVISIGRIIVIGAGPASQIQFSGAVPIDVYRIESATPLDAIINSTGGDIVAIDVGGLNRLQITGGDLGRTTVPSWGPDLIGPFLGLSSDRVVDVGGTLGVGGDLAGAFFQFWGGDINRPIGDSVFANGNVTLEDIGSPLDGYLNGLVVRDGNLQQLLVTGTVGDIILQGETGAIVTATVNSDRINPFDRFEGVEGHIFAYDIQQLDIGDGLLKSDPGPFQTTGIVAINNIVNITSGRTSGAVVSGTINAFDFADDFIIDGDGVDGIQTFTLTNALIKDATITAEDLDGFWFSFNYADGEAPSGDIGNFTFTNTTIFRSRLAAFNYRNVTLTGPNGYFDASDLNATGDIQSINATGYRNSTLTGALEEIRLNRIQGARDLQRLTATADITDLVLDITGNVRQSITAVNVSRSKIDVDGRLEGLTLLNDLRGSSVTVGSLPTLTVGRNIQSSSIFVSGILGVVTAGDRIANSDIEITGPGGSIGSITALNLISGTIASSGAIGTITSTSGDLIADISTTNGANVTSLTAGRDLVISGDVAGTVGTLVAGRNVGASGKSGVFLVRGTLTTLSAPNGQLYADIRVGQAIAGPVTIGAGTNKPGNVRVSTGSIISFGNIASVVINGDFDGDIISYSGGITAIAINNGSLLPGNTIAAYNASLTSVIITNGNLYGNVHADVDITSLRVLAGADGVFGDIGVSPFMSGVTSVDSRRNQLPVGVATDSTIQGPRISAGRDIVSIAVPGGSVFETTFTAARNINSINIGGTVQNDLVTLGISSVFAAGDAIDNITISGGVNNTAFLAGFVSFGADNRPGGTGVNADVLKAGSIRTVNISNGFVDGKFSAGIDAGADGIYNTSDDRSVQGISSIDNINLSGPVVNISVFGDVLPEAILNDSRFTTGGTNLPSTNPQIVNAQTLVPLDSFSGSRTFDNVNGANITFNLTGPGSASFNAGNATLTLFGTTSASGLTVTSSTGVITNVDVVTVDDASMGTVRFNGTVAGDSDLVVDGGVTTLTYGNFTGTGSISLGGNVTTATFASFEGGFLSARSITTLNINGRFGNVNPAVINEASITVVSAGTIAISGAASGQISVDRDATSLTVGGTVDRSAFRFGGSLGLFTAPNLNRTFLATGDNLGPVTIAGDVFQSNIQAGADLGRDSAPGGTGRNADIASSGNIGIVLIGGNFAQSSLTAGYLRGPDGYFGTSDHTVAGGRSTIASVTIAGNQTGSTRNSESYRIASNGTIGPVSIGGQAFNGVRGNFATEALNLAPQAVKITSVDVTVESGVSTANLSFNQPINASTLSTSLSVSEVRGTGEIEIRLVEGIDYTVVFDAGNNVAKVTFLTSVTSRNLPAVPGRPGPGVYRFRLEQSKFSGRLTGVQLDGNGDGASPTGDDFSQDTIVGDAGDKIVPGTVFTGPGNSRRIDFYGPTSLDLVLDNNTNSDGLPDANVPYTIRGFIGDHPDNDTNFFRFGGDLDLYSITLQAGQILRLGALGGTAINTPVNIFNPQGVPDGTQSLIFLATDRTDDDALTFGSDYLVKITGTYIIAVGNSTNIGDTQTITNPNPPPGGTGAYHFTVEIFDDGDSGFRANTNSGNGTDVVNAPAPISFAGNDQTLGTADDLPSITIGSYVFTYNPANGRVSGLTSDGQISSVRAADGTLTSTISSAIGPVGHAGIPQDFAADVDIFHLNSGRTIAPGTRITLTVKLSDLGADLGSASFGTGVETRGAVQFGVFDTTNSTDVDDSTLIFSPTDFSPNGGKPNTVIADNGSTRYGYDANGDFYISFLAPDRLDAPGNPASFAVYIQGVRNTDYQLQIVTGTAAPVALPKTSQNFFIETNGGTINWLEAGNQTTSLLPFNPATLAFTGTINGVPVASYILSNVVAQLNGLFRSGGPNSGFNVNFSSNPADFEFQPFSTVFVSSSVDPITPIFNPFSTGSAQPYGYAEHSDALNADLEDEAVVFVPSFALQGLSPSKVDVDKFIQATTAAIARRAGELMGLRVTAANASTTSAFDPLAANSVDTRPGAGRAYTLPGFNRDLSSPFDSVQRTDFYLGQQNARSLLDKVLSRI